MSVERNFNFVYMSLKFISVVFPDFNWYLSPSILKIKL